MRCFWKACVLLGILVLPAVSARVGKVEDEALLEACEGNSTEQAEKALAAGADPNAVGGWREASALHAALARGNAGLVALLEKAGADFQRREGNGESALHAAAGAWASREGVDEEILLNVQRVLDHGIPVDARDKAGREPLEEAAPWNPEIVRILLARGAKASPAALAAAMAEGNRASAQQLMAAGADPGAVLPGGRTMLHALAEVSPDGNRNSLSDMPWLLDLVTGKGVSVNARDAEGLTPLLVAAGTHWAWALEWLLAHGADAKAVDAKGRTALMIAAEREDAWSSEAAGKLMAAGCPVDAVDSEGRGIIQRLRERENWSGMLLLLRNGATMAKPAEVLRDALLVWRETPAAREEMREIVERLLASARELPGFAVGGRPLVVELVFLGDAGLLEKALQLGFKPDETDGEGRSALMWAAAFRDSEMEAMLRKAGADPLRRDASGRTAGDWAKLAAAKLLSQ